MPLYPDPAIPEGALIAISGVTGYLGSHIADQFLLANYRVRGCVRAPEKADPLQKLFDGKYGEGKFEIAVVPDADAEGAFDEAVKGAACFVHTVADLTLNPDPNKVIPWVVKGVTNSLESAAKEPSIKRFVFTSSATTLTLPKPGKKFHMTDEDWNEEDPVEAWKEPFDRPDHGWNVYAASKTASEKAVWKFVEEKKPGFVVNTVCPYVNFGPILFQPPRSTALWIAAIWGNQLDQVSWIWPQYHIDVQDTARIHMVAALNPEIKGERLFCFGETWTWSKLVRICREYGKEVAPDHKLPDEIPDEKEDLSTFTFKRGPEMMKPWGLDKWTPLEVSVKNCIKSLG